MGMLLALSGLLLHSHLPCTCLEAKPFSEPLELIRKTRNSIHNFNYRDKKLDERHNPSGSVDPASPTDRRPRGAPRMPTRRCPPAAVEHHHAHRTPSPFS